MYSVKVSRIEPVLPEASNGRNPFNKRIVAYAIGIIGSTSSNISIYNESVIPNTTKDPKDKKS